MRVAHVSSWLDRRVGGPYYSIPSLCGALADEGIATEFHTLLPLERRRELDGVDVHEYPAWSFPRKLGVSPALRRSLFACVRNCDVIHWHGLWTMPNIYPASAARSSPCRLVVSPRGMLAPAALGVSRMKKKIMWSVCQRCAVRSAALIHATSFAEAEDIQRAGLTVPIAIIPNGVDIPLGPKVAPEPTERCMLFLGRIHPIKGLDGLIRAWRMVQSDFPEWHLRIAGPDVAFYSRNLRALAGEIGALRIHFEGPLYGKEKVDRILASCILVLPSLSENFGMVVAESLSLARPVIASKGTPWAGLVDHGCGWWVDIGAESLAESLRTAMAAPQEVLSQMGRNGLEWMKLEFSWKRVGQMMHETYQWLLTGTSKPKWLVT